MVAAWDLPTRIFHWLLALLVVSAWASYEFAEAIGDPRLVWHRWNGFAILNLVVWRLMWGLWGSSTSRFRNFVRGPGEIARYAGGLVRGTSPRYLGHNPAGALMVVALLAVTGASGVLGLFAVEENDLATGPLYGLVGEAMSQTLTRWHRLLFEPVLLVLISLHIAANVLYGVVKREPLIPAMISGRKPCESYADAPKAHIPPDALWRALLTLVAAKALVFGTIIAAGGKLW